MDELDEEKRPDSIPIALIELGTASELTRGPMGPMFEPGTPPYHRELER